MHPRTDPPGFVTSILDTFFARGDSECIIVLDDRALVRGWSRASELLLGWTEEEMSGQPLACIFTPEDREKKIHAYELEAATADGYAEDDRWHLRKDGSRVWVTGTLSSVRNPGGGVAGYVKILRDRTDLRTKMERVEKEVAALQGELERTRHFLHTLGHELRNPLAPLSMAVQLLGMQETRPAAGQA
ncbi:MAG: PAS domain S-box protein, partial [Burkholderiaceae bacterium]